MSGPPIRALALKDGRIAALGPDPEHLAPAPPVGADFLEFPGGCVLPGFWDCHVHIAWLGAMRAACWLFDARSISEIVQRVSRWAAAHPDAPAVPCRTANLEPAALAEGRMPAPADLDAVERPVVISDVNKCLGNTAALAAAGIDPAACDPPGVLWFGEKSRLERILPPQRQGAFAERFEAGLHALAALGVTTAVEGYATPDEVAAIRRLDAEGRLPCRVIVQLAASTPEQVHAFEASGLEFAQPLGPLSQIGPAKIFYDQFAMHRTARMTQPYQDESANTGAYFNGPEAFAQRLQAARDRGFPVAVHVTGDAGLAEAVDAMAREGCREGSFIIHGYFVPEGTAARMAGLGIGLAAQPAFLYHWADTLERFVGTDRVDRFYPFDHYLAAGVAVGASADAPIADPDPLLGLYAATTRRSASGRTWGPDHALAMDAALTLYGESAARLFPSSGLSARLAIGEPADFVVLDRDPRTFDPADLRSIGILATFVAGRPVHTA